MAKKKVGKSAKPKSGAQNAKRNPRGAAKPAASAKKTSNRKPGRWARNTAHATERATATSAKMSKRERDAIIEQGKSYARQRRARIRDVGQDIPEGYLRRQGSKWFALKENYRPDADRNGREKQAFVLANKERFMREKGWLDSTSKGGMLDKDGVQNLRKLSTARKMLTEAGLYGHAGTHKQSEAMIYWGQDGKAP